MKTKAFKCIENWASVCVCPWNGTFVLICTHVTCFDVPRDIGDSVSVRRAQNICRGETQESSDGNSVVLEGRFQNRGNFIP